MSARMTTPPPATSMPAVPDTPRWGYDDNYEPYPATRAATRRLQSAQKTEKAGVPATPRKSSHITLASGVKVKRPVFTGTAFSGTPPATQAKKSGRTIVFEDETKLNLNGSPSKKVQPKASTGTGMFATPARSPEKKKVENIEGLGSISRTLFSARHAKLEDAMPSPRKRGKYADLIGGASKEPIAIFTDSKEMIPEKDNSIDNPFYGSGRRHAAAGGALKKSRKRKAGAFEEEVKKTETESKGAMYMFRGKKVYQDFASSDEEAESDAELADAIAAELDESVPSRLRGPITRSSLKPRILFADHADEEAETDIETEKHIPVKEKVLKTPRAAKKHLPISPPSTMQTGGRFKDEVAGVATARASFSSTGSHSQEFKSWQTAGSGVPHAEKRSARVLSPTPEVGRHSKRLRSSHHGAA